MHLHYQHDDKKSEVKVDDLIQIEISKARSLARIFSQLAHKVPQEKHIKKSLKFLHFFNLVVGLSLLITGSVLFRRRLRGRFFLGKRVFLVLAVTLAVNGFSLAIFSCFGFFTLGKRKILCLIHGMAGLLMAVTVIVVSVRVPDHEVLLLHTESNMFLALKKYNASDFIKDVWDQTQTSLDCCGVRNASDWCELSRSNSTQPCELPHSCFKCPPFCIEGDWGNYNGTTNENSRIRTRGCLNQVISHLSKSIALYMNLNYLLIALLGFSAIVSLVMFSRKRPDLPRTDEPLEKTADR